MSIMQLASTLHYLPRYKNFPVKEVGSRIREKALAIINHITRKFYSILYLLGGITWQTQFQEKHG
jgi:hypothetical protein